MKERERKKRRRKKKKKKKRKKTFSILLEDVFYSPRTSGPVFISIVKCDRDKGVEPGGQPSPTQRVPRWRIGERLPDMGVRGCSKQPSRTKLAIDKGQVY